MISQRGTGGDTAGLTVHDLAEAFRPRGHEDQVTDREQIARYFDSFVTITGAKAAAAVRGGVR